MGYKSTFKRKEILTRATTRMNLENIMLNEISQAQKHKTVCFHLYEVPSVVRSRETERIMW